MPRHISFIFPGQGSQHLGMLDDNLKKLLNIHKNEINDSLGFNLMDIIDNGPVEDLNRTSITQPAILLTSYLYFKNICEELDIIPNTVCGHSLGEYSALVAADCISLKDGLSLVNKRGILMEKCKAGSMCAILDTDINVITNLCSKVEKKLNTIVVPANLNSASQTVISGTNEGVAEVVKELKNAGHKKCIKLKVSVASHSEVMNETLDKFKDEINKLKFTNPKYEIIQNVDFQMADNVENLKNKLLNQLIMPVQWSKTMQYIQKFNGIVIECGPSKVLSGLAKANGIDNVFSTSSDSFFDDIRTLL